jgi:hypothetical protein
MAEVGGAQEASTFKQIFEELQKYKTSNVTTEGDVCLPDEQGQKC